MNEPYQIGLIGCGTVGSGVAQLLLEQPERLAARAGRPLVLRRVVVRDPDKVRPVLPPRSLLTTDLRTRARRSGHCLSSSRWSAASTGPGRRFWICSRRARMSSPPTRRCSPSTGPRSSTPPASTAGPSPSRPASPAAFPSSPPCRSAWPPTRSSLARHPQRHLQLHPHRHDRARPKVTPTPWPRPSAAATPRPTRPSTWTAPTRPTSWPSSPRSPSAWRCRPFHRSAPRHRRRSTNSTSASPARLGYTIKLLAEAWLTARTGGSANSPCTSRRCCCGRRRPLAQVRGAYNAIHVVGDAVGDTLLLRPGGGPDADGQRRRGRPDRHGRRPGPAHVSHPQPLVGPENGVMLQPSGDGAQPVLPAAAGRGPARRHGGDHARSWPTTTSASPR